MKFKECYCRWELLASGSEVMSPDDKSLPHIAATLQTAFIFFSFENWYDFASNITINVWESRRNCGMESKRQL